MTKTEARERTRRECRKVPCPKCGAEPGERCKGPSGFRKSVHRERRYGTPVPAQPNPLLADRLNRLLQPAELPDNDRLQEYIGETMCDVERLFRVQINNLRRRCESPIEELFASALVLHKNGASILGVALFPFCCDFAQVKERRASQFDSTDVFLQAQVGAYRADFLFDDMHEGKRRLFIVELDGHDWHERSKAQATRDKRRDRALVAAGYRILRFTGSEIYADPSECLQEVVDAILAARRGE